jgi:hypothetical protein
MKRAALRRPFIFTSNPYKAGKRGKTGRTAVQATAATVACLLPDPEHQRTASETADIASNSKRTSFSLPARPPEGAGTK